MWFPLVAVLFIFLLIARFYQRFSGSRTFFWLYGFVMVAFGVHAVRYASLDQISGDTYADAFGVVGGLLLIGLSTRLVWQMLYAKRA